MDERGIATVEVRPEAVERYNAEVQAMMPGTVWSSGCASWYLDAPGNNTTLWPDFTFRFRKRTRHFDADAYELRCVHAAETGGGGVMRLPFARPDYDVAGRTVFVTGAARGIGAAIATRLHAAGANVALVGLEPELLEQLAASLGDRAVAFEADVTDLEALRRAVRGTVERFGGIDVGDRERRDQLHRPARDGAGRSRSSARWRSTSWASGAPTARSSSRSRRGAATS